MPHFTEYFPTFYYRFFKHAEKWVELYSENSPPDLYKLHLAPLALSHLSIHLSISLSLLQSKLFLTHLKINCINQCILKYIRIN